ncbi:unnamed protein product [Microthlaspi erraticum]|uniref:PUM-HD domain-containing protein n=1 Tax=Microthlaspi erraticum TaxID=1685480 RepID=A0A6D2J4C3_9BRAS|nr:unnamed protein product [Microthlaspi erraticum]
MAYIDSFSMSTMNNALPKLRFAAAREPFEAEIPTINPPPLPRGFPIVAPPARDDQNLISSLPGDFFPVVTSDQEREMRLQWMFNFMTSSEQEDAISFKEMISSSRLARRELQTMASLLTSDPDYFLEIARNKNGSSRLRKLLGKSDDVDNLLAAAIMRRFLRVMTCDHAPYVVVRGMQVFDEAKKEVIYEQLLSNALDIARAQHGCIALNEIITDSDHPYYRNQLLDVVAQNALWLSSDVYGNFVIQHVLKLNDLRCTRNIAVSLRGHCVDLSSKKYGSYIVEKLLDAKDSVVVFVVVEELLKCEGHVLLRLARSDCGNFVVSKALRVTQNDLVLVDLFRGLVDKLMPFLHFLRGSRGSKNIADILEPIC